MMVTFSLLQSSNTPFSSQRVDVVNATSIFKSVTDTSCCRFQDEVVFKLSDSQMSLKTKCAECFHVYFL
ncbi:hypothetical protein PMI36_03320 [Pseudomonas sp. GM79]|nr:hypothetical protein PMI36_03320 [Pseudomonas sp. GM79]